MKKIWKISIIAILVIILIFFILIGNINKRKNKKSEEFNIVTSFYPIYIMTKNITNGAKNINVSNMAEKLVGCIHDYTLSTNDLKKFENAKVFIENGRNLEEFTDKIISIYSDIKIIESGKNVKELIEDEEEVNAHIWLNIDNYIEQIKTITEELSKLNSENAEKYNENSKTYIQKLENLKIKYEEIEKNKEKKAICLNESLEYLLKQAKVDTTLIETDHEQSVLSAENIKEIIEKMKRENIKAIFIDKDDSDKTAKMLEEETSAKIYILNSGLNGVGELDDYINIMKDNLKVLKSVEF